MHWKTSRRIIALDSPIVMGILNVTPDSFSDGGRFANVDASLTQAERMIVEGADIIDVGGESTRPGSLRVPPEEEIARTAPVIAAIASRFDTPISIDTTKYEVAQAALDAGAEIINDISGLRWDERLAEMAASTGAGLVLMHSRGEFETMHSQPPVDDIVGEVIRGLQQSITVAEGRAVSPDQIVLDIGIGFGKTAEQSLELLGSLDKIARKFENSPLLVGASRKSFIAKLLGDVPPDKRLGASIASAVIAVQSDARVIRVHDVAETVQALRLLEEIGNG